MYLTVTQVAKRLGKSEETIKRWLRAGSRFPNAYKKSDTEGWRIPQSDLDGQALTHTHQEQITTETLTTDTPSHVDISELVTFAYQAVTQTYPTDEIIQLLTKQGIKRTLEILLVMSQSDKVKNPVGFIKTAIKEGWTPNTIPKKVDRRRMNVDERHGFDSTSIPNGFPFYNWLEGE